MCAEAWLGLLGERHYLLIYVCKPNKMDGFHWCIDCIALLSD